MYKKRTQPLANVANSTLSLTEYGWFWASGLDVFIQVTDTDEKKNYYKISNSYLPLY